MTTATRLLIAAGFVLAVAAYAPAADADPTVVCVEGACQGIDPGSVVPTVIVCNPVVCDSIHLGPEPGAGCSASGDGDGVRVECHG